MVDSLTTFEIENNVRTISAQDKIYKYDNEEQKRFLSERPWTANPNYFTKAKISALALVKMTIHARSGSSIEVMGMMTGKIQDDSIIVMDAFPLPVEGTETRVNPQAEAYEYMVSYLDNLKAIGRDENIVGWYHSHPGYGCWLSGIDVSTQSQNQEFQDPFLAVVIDPNRTISAGKVDIGAFRTYPPNYKPPEGVDSQYQTIPLSKMEDFGAHANTYYALDVSHFKSSLDTKLLELLWNKYWVSTLSSSPYLLNMDYSNNRILDLSRKISLAKQSLVLDGPSSLPPAPRRVSSISLGGASLQGTGGNDGFSSSSGGPQTNSKKESEIDRLTRDASSIAVEDIHALLSQSVKNKLFNLPSPTTKI